MARDPVPGTSYLRQLAPQTGAWWRVLVASAAVAVGGVVLAIAAILLVTGGGRLLGYDDYTVDPNDGIDAGEMFATNLGLALLIPFAGLLAFLLYGVRPRWLSSTRPGVRWRWLLTCVAMALVIWSPLLVLGTTGAAVTRDEAIGRGVVAFIVVVLLTTPLQAAGEEYVFRGLLLQGFGATRLPALACCFVTGVLFATAHLQFDPALYLDRLLLGTVFAYLTMRTGGLEAGIAIHLVKNVAGLIPAGLLDDVESALDPGDVSWIPVAIDAILLGIAVPWILRAWRRSAEQRAVQA